MPDTPCSLYSRCYSEGCLSSENFNCLKMTQKLESIQAIPWQIQHLSLCFCIVSHRNMQTPWHAITQVDRLSLSPSHPAWPGVQGCRSRFPSDCSWCTSLALDLQMKDEYIWPHSHKERVDPLLAFCCTSFAGQSLVNHAPFLFMSLRCTSGTGEHNVLCFAPWGAACASGNSLLISVFIVKLPVSELLTNSLRRFSL